MEDVAAGIRVLQTRDGVPLTDDQVLERARNIVTGLIGNYKIQTLDSRRPRAYRGIQQLNLLDQIDPGVDSRNARRPARA